VVACLLLNPGFGLTCKAADLPTELPFKLLRGTHILVKGSVGQEQNVNMLIDTGALTTTVDERLVKRLGIETQSLQASGILQGSTSVSEAELPVLAFGHVKVPSWSVLVLDLSRIDLGERIDVIVGLDILQHLPALIIDYERRVLALSDQVPFRTKVKLDREHLLLRIVMEVEGTPLLLMIDSGADGVILFDERVKGKAMKLKMLQNVTTNHVGGKSFGRRVELRDVTLGDQSWDRLQATLLGTPAPAGLELDGLISLNTFDAQRVSFDFDGDLLSWE
jgi:predicted aspartyl protease